MESPWSLFLLFIPGVTTRMSACCFSAIGCITGVNRGVNSLRQPAKNNRKQCIHSDYILTRLIRAEKTAKQNDFFIERRIVISESTYLIAALFARRSRISSRPINEEKRERSFWRRKPTIPIFCGIGIMSHTPIRWFRWTFASVDPSLTERYHRRENSSNDSFDDDNDIYENQKDPSELCSDRWHRDTSTYESRDLSVMSNDSHWTRIEHDESSDSPSDKPM